MQDAELLHEFVEEAREHLGDVEMQLLQVEAMGADINDDLVNTLFRAIHSVKGAAGFLGLTEINKVAHRLENVLGKVRDHKLIPDPFNVDVMLKAADRLRNLIEDIDNSNGTDNNELCEKLDALLAENAEEPIKVETATPEVTPVDVATEKAPDETSKKTPVAKKKRATKRTPRKTKAAAKPNTKKQRATGSTAKTVATNAKAEGGEVDQAREKTDAAAPSKSVESKSVDSKLAAGTQPGPSRPAAAESSIRVGIRVLDRLMNLAGELVLSRNQLLRVLGEHHTESNLDAIVSGLDQVTTELQETIMQTRMQPIGNVFNKFTRVVRDLSNQLGKQCELNIAGKEVEVDKTIIEAISDPLTHLVRNSVDHGVEKPDARIAAGKLPAGRLNLRAFHQSGKVRLEIADDGKGIDAAVLRDKAVNKGLLSQEQADAMSDREAVRLIFHPGFSTAQEVTDVSGRGVGMDVVRSNIEKLGGTVDIETQVNVGTTISVTLPLTLAIIPSLIVRSGHDRFAIPQVNIAELVRIGNDEGHRIGQVNNKEVLRLRGSLLPLVRLKEALDLKHSEADASGVRHIIVVESGPLRYGLVVDDVCDSEEIVVKPLGRHLNECPCLSGATILGDGRVALILDVNGTAQQSKLRACEETHTDVRAVDEPTNNRERRQSVLLFTNDPSEQFAMPMELIARIERIRSDQIVSVGCQELLHYRNGSLPLLRLEDTIRATPGPDQTRYYVIVFEAAGREVGVLAARLIDIRDVADRFDATTFDDPAVLGSQVIDDRTTRLLDTIRLSRLARPDWFNVNASDASPAAIATAGPSGPTQASNTVLLVEDSSFFRQQVKGFLEDTGFTVVDCEDGRDAWNVLQESPERFHMVLTDIEMPNMDGLELTRRIRSEDRFAELPIIALTSLASQEDFQRGFDAGVTEYQVKLDRDQLIATILRYASSLECEAEPALLTV